MCPSCQKCNKGMPEGRAKEGGVAQVASVRLVGGQGVGWQLVSSPVPHVGVGCADRCLGEAVLVALQQQARNLLQQDCVVALEGLEDVVVRAPGPQAVHRRIAVASAALAAHRQRRLRVVGGVRLEACPRMCTSELRTAQI